MVQRLGFALPVLTSSLPFFLDNLGIGGGVGGGEGKRSKAGI